MGRFMEVVKSSFAEKWERYLHIKTVDATKIWGNAEFSFIIELLNQYVFPKVSTTPKILDVGCGDGYLMHLLRDYDIYGITYKKEERDMAMIQNSEFGDRIVVGDIHDLPYGDKEFDICISRQSLEHMLSPVVVLWEIHRVLKLGGILLLHVPHNVKGEEDGTNPLHHYAFTPSQWINLTRLNGFLPMETGIDTQFGGIYIIAKRANKVPLIRDD